MLEKIFAILIRLDEKVNALLTVNENRSKKEEPVPHTAKKLICAKEAAAWLNVTQRTLYSYGMKGVVEYVVIRGRKYYVETSVVQIASTSKAEKRKYRKPSEKFGRLVS